LGCLKLHTDYFTGLKVVGSKKELTLKSSVKKVRRQIEYLPFGEALVEEHLSSYNSPFKFNAKEFDAETGNYYYGARYYNPKWSIWLSVDPLFEKYPTLSPYIYTANNPIIYIDPDGKEIEGVNKSSAESFHEDINTVFADEKFDSFRELITRGKKNNKASFDKIDQTKFNEATADLEGDDKILAEVLFNAINSDKKNVVEYLDGAESSFSSKGKEVFANELNRLYNYNGNGDELKGGNLMALGGSGYSASTQEGSHSFIVKSSNHLEGKRALTSFHEVLGHGVPHSKNIKGTLNHDNAIRLENLTRRVMNIGTMRDGTNPIHGGGHKVINNTGVPIIK